ncbi:MAG: hopanoid biosynthesis associated radical SAM protein HpnJ [Nitrospirae bacterium]|nr:MAG: hopanoid biosynthesis associated radical SAM protein HpnJ [Nitrospirota bacterium]
MRVLFLNPPSYEHFDGGAGSRYQAAREVSSFWYPTWLCYAAGLVPESRVLDAPAEHLSSEEVSEIAKYFNVIVIFTSTSGFKKDVETATLIKVKHPEAIIGFVGPHPTILPEETLKSSPAIDFVARGEFDYTIKEIAEGRQWQYIKGLSYWHKGFIIHNPDRELIEDLDSLPFVTDIYHRDLNYKNYQIPYLLYPYISIYTGRGCPGRCIYCLWPQTFTGHKYRTRSVENVIEEVKHTLTLFPDVAEIFFDDDTFTANEERIIEFCKAIKPIGITWSTTSRANVRPSVLKMMKDAGLRLLVVGYETGNEEILKRIKKGVTLKQMRNFTRECKRIGIKIHGTFILGLPGESHKSIEDSIRFACELDPDTIQVSLAAAYPGTEFYEICQNNGYFVEDEWVDKHGCQVFNLRYEDIEPWEIYKALEKFYKRFYYRPKRLAKIIMKMAIDPKERRRRIEEGREFKRFLKHRHEVLDSWLKRRRVRS